MVAAYLFFGMENRDAAFFLDVMQITCEREVYTQERTETRRDRYCWPLLGDGTVFLKRRRVVPLPEAFLGGVQEDAHTGRYLEVIPGRHDIGSKCLGCGIKHGKNGGPGDTGP